MDILLIACLGALSTFLFSLSTMSRSHEKKLHSERIEQIVVSKYISNIDKKPEVQNKKMPKRREKRRKRRLLELNLFSLVIISFLVCVIWYLNHPIGFPIKFTAVFLGLLIFKRVWIFIQKRKYRGLIEEQLTSVLDLLVVCIEAGMSITSALVRVSEEIKGTPLSQELRNTFHEIDVGLPLEEAFRNLGERTGVQDLQSLATSVIQSEKLGIGLGETLRNQAKFMRETTRLRTKEKILKIPVKLIVPLVLCILPALFVVLGGPSAVQIKNNLFASQSASSSSSAR